MQLELFSSHKLLQLLELGNEISPTLLTFSDPMDLPALLFQYAQGNQHIQRIVHSSFDILLIFTLFLSDKSTLISRDY